MILAKLPPYCTADPTNVFFFFFSKVIPGGPGGAVRRIWEEARVREHTTQARGASRNPHNTTTQHPFILHQFRYLPDII
jgi:hypothetical protein